MNTDSSLNVQLASYRLQGSSTAKTIAYHRSSILLSSSAFNCRQSQRNSSSIKRVICRLPFVEVGSLHDGIRLLALPINAGYHGYMPSALQDTRSPNCFTT